MTKIVWVTPAQVMAAKLKLKRAAATGKVVSPAVSAIANAKRATSAHSSAAQASQNR